MGGKTPAKTKQKVLKLWLSGNTRKKIAEKAGIGEGTVSSIVQEAKDNIPDVDLLREVAVEINRKALNLNNFSAAIRHRNLLYERGLDDDQIDSLVENVDEYCYKRGIGIGKFCNLVKDVTGLSEMYGCPVDKLEELIEKLVTQRNSLQESIKILENSRLTQLEKNNITANDIEEYKQAKPLLTTLSQKDHEIWELKTRIILDNNSWTILDKPKSADGSPLMLNCDILNAAHLMVRNAARFENVIYTILKNAHKLQFPLTEREQNSRDFGYELEDSVLDEELRSFDIKNNDD